MHTSVLCFYAAMCSAKNEMKKKRIFYPSSFLLLDSMYGSHALDCLMCKPGAFELMCISLRCVHSPKKDPQAERLVFFSSLDK